jgi:hypothetical protein
MEAMDKQKTEHLYIPVSPEEKLKICQGAFAAGLRMSPWARSILLAEAGMALTEVRLS